MADDGSLPIALCERDDEGEGAVFSPDFFNRGVHLAWNC